MGIYYGSWYISFCVLIREEQWSEILVEWSYSLRFSRIKWFFAVKNYLPKICIWYGDYYSGPLFVPVGSNYIVDSSGALSYTQFVPVFNTCLLRSKIFYNIFEAELKCCYCWSCYTSYHISIASFFFHKSFHVIDFYNILITYFLCIFRIRYSPNQK